MLYVGIVVPLFFWKQSEVRTLRVKLLMRPKASGMVHVSKVANKVTGETSSSNSAGIKTPLRCRITDFHISRPRTKGKHNAKVPILHRVPCCQSALLRVYTPIARITPPVVLAEPLTVPSRLLQPIPGIASFLPLKLKLGKAFHLQGRNEGSKVTEFYVSGSDGLRIFLRSKTLVNLSRDPHC